ncbi:MAG: cyclic nucleotide-binding domain-containing protein [Actinobacteria bacterium]|nr:cyclic nucleotide-binding domain-containing protein [Actinomycetota bacterium]
MDATRLEQVPIFRELSRKQRKLVASHADDVSLPEGSKIAEQGQLAYELFFIVEGTADVLDDGTKIAELGPGDVVGEIGVLETHSRTATVVATSPIEAIVMYGPELMALDKELPGVFAQLQDLVRERLSRGRPG